MKKIILFIGILLLASCSGQGFRGNPGAIQVGASIGGIVGSIIGGNMGGYNGSSVGALVGTVAGAAVGNAATTPKKEIMIYRGYDPPEIYEEGIRMQEMPELEVVIKNIRFIDEGRNQAISAGEKSQIIFDLVSLAGLPIHGVTVYVEDISDTKHLKISSPLQISSLLPGSKLRCTAVVTAGKKLKSGAAAFRIQACEREGACSPAREFSIPLQGKKK